MSADGGESLSLEWGGRPPVDAGSLRPQALTLDLSTMGGSVLEVAARRDWSVKDVKRAVEKAWGSAQDKQRLVNSRGIELRDGKPLQDFCVPEEERMQLTLVILPKTQAEIDWEERWLEVTPPWLREATEVILDQDDFKSMRRRVAMEPEGPDCIFHGRYARCSCHCADSGAAHGAGESSATPGASTPIELTCGELLACMRSRPHNIEVDWRTTSSSMALGLDSCSRRPRTATREVVKRAVEREPELILPYVQDLSLVLDVVESIAGIFYYLPQQFQEYRCVLYAALDKDVELQAEFLQTAGRREIHEWQWEQELDQGRGLLGKKRRSVGKKGKR